MNIRLLICVLLFAVACGEKDPSICDGDQEKDWLTAKKKEMDDYAKANDFGKYMYLSQGKHQGQVIYITGNCCPFCTYIPEFYNCAGERLEDSTVNRNEITETKVIWHSEDTACAFM